VHGPAGAAYGFTADWKCDTAHLPGERAVLGQNSPSPGNGAGAGVYMKAFVMKGLDHVGFSDKPIPRPGPNDAVVKTTKALICTSDAHTVHGAIGPRENLTLGHEAVGIIHEVGSEVRRFKPGERVVVGAITPDWGDGFSQSGHPSQSGGALGGWKFANIKDGVFAEYFHVNEADANLAMIPDDVADDSAVYCCDMISTGLMASENARIPLGGTVAVFALGPVGLMAVAGARLLGAGLIVGIDSVPRRQQLARSFGADILVDHREEDVVRRVLALTGGLGVDSAIEALGSAETLRNAVSVTRPGGTISNAGYHGKGDFVGIPRLDWGVGMAEKVITTGLCPGGGLRMERLLRLIQGGRIDPTPLTTHRFPFTELDRAFTVMDQKLDGVIKPLIIF
jgi:isopropanol dehydrogenase (NADP+)